MTNSVIKRLRNRPRPKTHEERVEDAIDRLMLVEVFIMWYIEELEDLRAQLSMDPVLKRLVLIVEVMISQLWQLMRRWAKAKAEVIRAVRNGLTRRKRKIEGNGFWIEVLYSKHVIDLAIYLNGGGGDYTKAPDLGIPKEVLRAMRMGWRASDSSDDNDKYPEMTTYFIWQALAWLILHPGAEVSIYAEGISISLDGIKPIWILRVNGFEVEWPDDIKAYQEMARLPKKVIANCRTPRNLR